MNKLQSEYEQIAFDGRNIYHSRVKQEDYVLCMVFKLKRGPSSWIL
jgi:hypothetical protein